MSTIDSPLSVTGNNLRSLFSEYGDSFSLDSFNIDVFRRIRSKINRQCFDISDEDFITCSILKEWLYLRDHLHEFDIPVTRDELDVMITDVAEA